MNRSIAEKTAECKYFSAVARVLIHFCLAVFLVSATAYFISKGKIDNDVDMLIASVFAVSSLTVAPVFFLCLSFHIEVFIDYHINFDGMVERIINES